MQEASDSLDPTLRVVQRRFCTGVWQQSVEFDARVKVAAPSGEDRSIFRGG
jgi:hypothetical protein